MRLSDAIRLGATISPQVFGRNFDDRGGSCALGSALLAIGQRRGLLAEHFPITQYKNAVDPAPDCALNPHATIEYEATLGGVVARLNDVHRWSREQIADWVQSIEESPGWIEFEQIEKQIADTLPAVVVEQPQAVLA